MSEKAKVDPILLEIFWNRLIAIVTEQAASAIRVSFSPIVREAGDVATAIFDARGRMLVHGVTGTPGHVMPMIQTLKAVLDEYPLASINPGDAFITNDPWKTTGHLFDITVVSPISRLGKVVGFAATTAHHVDMGGLGLGANANDVFEEGLFIPMMKLHVAGQIDPTLEKIIRTNVREPDMVIGDLNAQLSANEAAAGSLCELLDEYHIGEIEDIAEEIFYRSERASRDAIAKVPNGTYHTQTKIDGYDSPITIVLALTVKDREIIADFTGTSPQVAKGINVCLNYVSGYVSFALRCAIGREIPNNHGSLSAFKVIAEPGTVVSCTSPAPVSARHVVGQMIPGIVLYTLSQAIPDDIIAEGSGSVWAFSVQGHTRGGRSFSTFLLNSGGMGARPIKDGLSTTQYPTGTRCVPMEVIELQSSVLYKRRELITDSGGAGKFRGGLGQRIDIEVDPNGDACLVTLVCERTMFAPRGLDGGESGRLGTVAYADGTAVGAKSREVLSAATTYILETPGGGGFGAPHERDPSDVMRDVELGYVSEQAAATVYGVSIQDGRLDEAATAQLRAHAKPGVVAEALG